MIKKIIFIIIAFVATQSAVAQNLPAKVSELIEAIKKHGYANRQFETTFVFSNGDKMSCYEKNEYVSLYFQELNAQTHFLYESDERGQEKIKKENQKFLSTSIPIPNQKSLKGLRFKKRFFEWYSNKTTLGKKASRDRNRFQEYLFRGTDTLTLECDGQWFQYGSLKNETTEWREQFYFAIDIDLPLKFQQPIEYSNFKGFDKKTKEEQDNWPYYKKKLNMRFLKKVMKQFPIKE